MIIKKFENYIITDLNKLRNELNIFDVTENDEYYVIYLKYFDGRYRINNLDEILRENCKISLWISSRYLFHNIYYAKI